MSECPKFTGTLLERTRKEIAWRREHDTAFQMAEENLELTARAEAAEKRERNWRALAEELGLLLAAPAHEADDHTRERKRLALAKLKAAKEAEK